MKQQIKELKKLYEEFDNIAEVFKENYLLAKERSEEVTYTNDAGEVVNIQEKHIWKELMYHPKGRESNAGKYLIDKYPKIFELEDKAEQKKKEIEQYEMKHFGFKGNNMRLVDLIDLIDRLIDAKK